MLQVLFSVLLSGLLALGGLPAAAQTDLLAPLTGGNPASSPSPEVAVPVIDPGTDPQEDAAIAQRLRNIYAIVDGLGPVQVQAASGVVVLSGEVSEQALKDQAVRLARTVRGVVEVENRIVVAQDLEGRLTPALKRLVDGWNGFIRLLPVLIVGLAIMAGAIVLGGWLSRRRALYRRLAANDFIASLLAQVAQGAVVIAGAALTLLLLDATGIVNTLLGAAGIVGLALGFALRDTVENYIASILLSVRRPFEPEDYVRIEGYEGVVARLTPRATVLLTLDGNQVRIPNATVFKGLIINFTADPHRRLTFQLGIGPTEDLGRVQRTAIEALSSVPGVLSDPPPLALYDSVSMSSGGQSSSVSLMVSGWMDQRSHDFLRVRSEAIRVVVARLGEGVGEQAGQGVAEGRSDRLGTPAQRRAEPATASGPAGPAPVANVQTPGVSTDRDPSLDPVVERERRGRPDLLDRGGAPE